MKSKRAIPAQVQPVVILVSHIVLLHRVGVAPTKQEIKQAIIQRLLDIEYAPGGDFWKYDRETWDMERQTLVLRCGWKKMNAQKLLASLSEG